MNEEEIEAEHAATLKLEERERFIDEQREPVLDEERAELDKERVEDEAFWFRVLQVSLAGLGVQSIGKAAEVSRLSIEETIELSNKIRQVK